MKMENKEKMVPEKYIHLLTEHHRKTTHASILSLLEFREDVNLIEQKYERYFYTVVVGAMIFSMGWRKLLGLPPTYEGIITNMLFLWVGFIGSSYYSSYRKKKIHGKQEKD